MKNAAFDAKMHWHITYGQHEFVSRLTHAPHANNSSLDKNTYYSLRLFSDKNMYALKRKLPLVSLHAYTVRMIRHVQTPRHMFPAVLLFFSYQHENYDQLLRSLHKIISMRAGPWIISHAYVHNGHSQHNEYCRCRLHANLWRGNPFAFKRQPSWAYKLIATAMMMKSPISLISLWEVCG